MPIDYTIRVLGAPVALAGFLVAAIVLAPESVVAVRAVLTNDLQRSVNILPKVTGMLWIADPK